MSPEMLQPILMVGLIGVAAYFLMIRPQQKRRKEQEEKMSSLETGSRVMLISGIIATVKYLGDKQAVVEISPGVEMTVDKRAISTQPVTDEFEYDDEDGGGDELETDPVEQLETTEAKAEQPDKATVAAEGAESEPAAKPADPSDNETDPTQTWDSPDTTRN